MPALSAHSDQRFNWDFSATCIDNIVSDQAFPIGAAKLWNELPGDVTASVSLTVFHRRLKTFLFWVIYPDSLTCIARRFAIEVFALTLTIILTSNCGFCYITVTSSFKW